jgi:hypothetical protein
MRAKVWRWKYMKFSKQQTSFIALYIYRLYCSCVTGRSVLAASVSGYDFGLFSLTVNSDNKKIKILSIGFGRRFLLLLGYWLYSFAQYAHFEYLFLLRPVIYCAILERKYLAYFILVWVTDLLFFRVFRAFRFFIFAKVTLVVV